MKYRLSEKKDGTKLQRQRCIQTVYAVAHRTVVDCE